MGHERVFTVESVQFGILDEFVSWKVLFQDGVDHHRNGGVESVVHHQEVRLVQGVATEVGEEHEEELTCDHGNVLVERVLDQESSPTIYLKQFYEFLILKQD